MLKIEIDKRCEDVNLTPTTPQMEAGNYKMAHCSVKGMRIAIENPAGSKRYYGNEGKYNVMKNHYGYFNITKGKDGDAVDVFLGPDVDDFENVYCVDQNNSEGEFDETKVMLGFKSKEEAKEAYLSNYDPTWNGFRDITAVSIKDFKRWLYRGRKQRQPFADYVYIQKKKLDEMKEMGNYKQINLDNVRKPVFDYELFDNGNANYYFTTEEPLPNNAATLEEFFEYYVEQTTQKIKWDFDWSYGGGQAFGTRDDGMEIQVDAGGNGDFMSHIITVTVQQNNQLNEKKMKNIIKLTESDIKEVIANSVKKVLKESYDGPTNEGPDWDEQVYYKALKIMKKYGFGGETAIDAVEHVMYTYLDQYKDEKLMAMEPEEAAKLIAREAMRSIDSDYYYSEVDGDFMNEGKNVIKISEEQFHDIIKNSVKRILKEGYEPTKADWDDFGEWASSDEPGLENDEIGAAHDKENPVYPIDADDEGEGYSKDYQAGVEYAQNLIAKGKDVSGIVNELNRKEDDLSISAFELGMLDTLDEG